MNETSMSSVGQDKSNIYKDRNEKKKSKFFDVKVFLVLMCAFSITQGFAVNGINNVNTSMYERRFKLSSTQTGLVSSIYDIMAGVAVLMVGYYGPQFHQPRLIGLAAGTLAIGSLVMALPQFLAGTYNPSFTSVESCLAADNNDTLHNCDRSQQELGNYYYMLLTGQGLHGLAGAVLYTIGTSYIDGSVSSTQSPLYIGIFLACSALGPAVGYMLGGWLLDIYVDMPNAPPPGLTAKSPGWVGAWWIGFLISFCSCSIIAGPLCLFPRVLPGTEERRRHDTSQAHDHGQQHIADGNKFGMSISDMPASILLLLKNPVFVCQCIIGGCEGLLVSGMATFLPKLIANQFNEKASWASMLTGFLAVPAAAVGQFLGGFIIRKHEFKIRAIIKFNMGCSAAVIICAAGFWISCKQGNIAGVTYSYDLNSTLTSVALQHACNGGCRCTTATHDPVCVNGVEYFSACHAGCSSNASTSMFSLHNCSCTLQGKTSTIATQGRCASKCIMLYVFAPIIFLAFLSTFFMTVPGTTIVLRSVNDKQRTFACSIQQMCLRFLGSIPGPLVFGSILDHICVVWQEKCDGKGSCWIYDNNKMGQNFFIVMVSIKIVSLACLLIAYKLYKPPSKSSPSCEHLEIYDSTDSKSESENIKQHKS